MQVLLPPSSGRIAVWILTDPAAGTWGRAQVLAKQRPACLWGSPNVQRFLQTANFSARKRVLLEKGLFRRPKE